MVVGRPPPPALPPPRKTMNALADGASDDVECRLAPLEQVSICRLPHLPRASLASASMMGIGSSGGGFAARKRRPAMNALTDGDDQPSEVCLPPVILNSLVQQQQQQEEEQQQQQQQQQLSTPLSASAARRKRRKRRPRSNSALLAALPPGQRDMFRSLWRATLQAFIQTRQIQGGPQATEEDPYHSESAIETFSQRHLGPMDEIDENSVRDPIIRRVVKEKEHSARNVLLEGELIEHPDKRRGRLSRHDGSAENHRDRSPSAKKRRSHSGSVDEQRRKEKKCKKRSHRSRSCFSGSSSSDSEPENPEHSSDHGTRKKARRSKKRKKDKHKGKKKSRRDSSHSGDERRKRHHHHHHHHHHSSSSSNSKEKDRGGRDVGDDRDIDDKQQQQPQQQLQHHHNSHSTVTNNGRSRSGRRDESRKFARGEEVHHPVKNAIEQRSAPGASKLSFSPLCDEEPADEEVTEVQPYDKNHVELSMKLPSKRVAPSRWFDDEDSHKPVVDLTGAGSSSSKLVKEKTVNGKNEGNARQGDPEAAQSAVARSVSPKSGGDKLAKQHSDSSDAEERLLNSHLPKSLRIQPTTKKNLVIADAVSSKEIDMSPGHVTSKGRSSSSPHQRLALSRQSSSSPDCAKIRKLLANKKVTSPDVPASNVSGTTSNGKSDLRNGSRSPSGAMSHSRSRSNSRSGGANASGGTGVSNAAANRPSSREPELSKWEKSDALPAAYRSRSNSRSKSHSAQSLSRSRSRDRSGGRSRSRSRSRSDSARSRRSRSGSERRSTSRRSGSRGRSRSRSYSRSRSSYSSRSRSRSRRYSSRSRSRSFSRSRSRSRSPSIPRRAGSPSFLDKRRITRAPDGPSWRKRRRRQSSSWDSRCSRSSRSRRRSSWSSTSTRSESRNRSPHRRRRRRRRRSWSSTSSGY